MENFVLAGRASTVFRLIELAAKRETLDLAMRNLSMQVKKQDEFICPRDNKTPCTKPRGLSCDNSRCPVYLSLEEKGGTFDVRD